MPIAASAKAGRSPSRRFWAAVLAFVFLLLVAGGARFYVEQEHSLRAAAEGQLQAILRLKVNQILAWRDDVTMDSADLAAGLLLTDVSVQDLAQPASSNIRFLQAFFRNFHDRYGLLDIQLADPQGRAWWSLSGRLAPPSPEASEAVGRALRTGEPALSDLFLEPEDGRPRLVSVAALPPRSAGAKEPMGVVVLSIDPARFLYPLVQSWPLPSKTAETLLIRRQGNEVLFLNDLRHRADAAFTLRLPLSRTEVPAVQAALGRSGIFAGRDYRGVRVLAALAPVPGSSWSMVAKEDHDEALAAWRTRSRLIILALSSLLLAAVIGMVALEQTEVRRHFQRMVRAEAYLRTILEASPVGIITCRVDGEIVSVNRAMARLPGAGGESPAGGDFRELPWWRESGILAAAEEALASGDERRIEVRLPAPSWPEPWISCLLVPFSHGGERFLLGLMTDISERKQAQEQLELLRTSIDTSSEAAFWMDPEGRFVFVNEAAARSVGYTAAELRNMTVFEVNARVTPERWAEVWRTLQERRSFTAESQHRRKDGTVFPVEISSAYVCFGGREYCNGFAKDITERKAAEAELRASEERFRMIFEHSAAGMVVVGPDLRFRRVNGAFRRMLGYSEEELLERTFASITFPGDVSIGVEQARRVLSGELEGFHLEKRYVRKDGRVVWGLVSSTLIRDAAGEPLHFIAQVEDITDRKEAEQEIRRLNEGLERRVRERTAELEAANKEMEAFAYSVSHDLRTPLRAINGYVKILQDEYIGTNGSEAARLGDIVRENAERMGRLIDGLLTLSRLSRKEPQRAQVDQNTLVHAVFEDLVPPEDRGRIDFRVADLPPAHGDPVFLREIWENLLSNALKFSSRRERAIIEVEAEYRDHELVFSVRDNGAGFDMAYSDKLFGVFQRLHSGEEFEGTGVGLAIVQRLVARHHGRVWAESRPGEGAVFHFSLPSAGDPIPPES